MSCFRIATLTLLSVLSGCASQAVHYYSLLPTSAALEQPANSGSASTPRVPYAISVETVQVPPQVDRPQIVFIRPDSEQLIPVSSALWASPLPQQIQVALANQLSSQLGALDVDSSVAAYKVPLWKVKVLVNRFESVYQQRAVLDASWQLIPVNMASATPKLCGAQIQIPVEATVSAMVQGHQQALKDLATVIAGQLKGQPFPQESNRLLLKGCT